MTQALQIIILAAGKGSRMRSALPKVLHLLHAKPLIQHVLSACFAMQPRGIVMVVGYGGQAVIDQITPFLQSHPYPFQFAQQTNQRGTADAVATALPYLNSNIPLTLILNGDGPFITTASLQQLCAAQQLQQSAVQIMTFATPQPSGYGRILRQGKQFIGIIEEKEASAAQKQLQECNGGIYLVATAKLHNYIEQVMKTTQHHEYYLTDIVATAVALGDKVATTQVANADECLGINTPEELAAAEKRWHQP